MQFITIKQSYLWKVNSTITNIEFPNNILIGFHIRKRSCTTYLILFIRSRKHKTKKIYCKVKGLTNTQIFELKQSLQHAKEYAKN